MCLIVTYFSFCTTHGVCVCVCVCVCVVQNAMHTAITCKWPQHRMAVGYDTPFWLLFASLPSFIADPILAHVVKQPLPAILKNK
jgi:uncharacterized membrane protein YozB (DUF420 family)